MTREEMKMMQPAQEYIRKLQHARAGIHTQAATQT